MAEPFVGTAPQFGTYDLSGQSPAGRLLTEEYFIQAYVGQVADRTNPDISPLYGDLRGLPPALLIIESLDVVLEDNLAIRLRTSVAAR
jgi:acetyl esterase/lipase